MDPDLNEEQSALEYLKEKRRISAEPSGTTGDDQSETPANVEEEADEQEIEAGETRNIEESGEPEGEEQPAESEDDGPLYYQIGDKEVTLETIQGWEQGSLRQQDYTKKTQDLADSRKQLEVTNLALKEKEGAIASLLGDLQKSIDNQDEAINWDDLAETDPSEYLLQKRKLDARKDVLKKARLESEKVTKQRTDETLLVQQKKMRDILPGWFDGTETQQKDLKLIGDYLAKEGFTDKEMNDIVDARQWKIYLKAAKMDAIEKSNPKVKNKLKNAPKVIKPSKSRSRITDSSLVDEAAKKAKSTGKETDILAFMKQKRVKQ